MQPFSEHKIHQQNELTKEFINRIPKITQFQSATEMFSSQ